MSGRFTERAGVYAASRPSYPDGAIRRLLGGIEVRDAADVGAGTGISSRLLAAAGVRVMAVEPDEAMRRKGKAAGGGVTWRAGTGEATGLDDASVDLVLCAQAFHWMRGEEAVGEFRRILRRPGRIALMWNVHDVGHASMARYREIMLRYATDPPRSPWYRGFNDALAGATDLDFEVSRFEMTQVVDREGLIGRAMSSSYVPMSGEAHEALRSDLMELFDDSGDGDVMTLHYETSLYIADVT